MTAKLDVPEGSHQLLLDGTRLLVATQPYTGIDTVVSLFDVSDVVCARRCCAAATSKAGSSRRERSTARPAWC